MEGIAFGAHPAAVYFGFIVALGVLLVINATSR